MPINIAERLMSSTDQWTVALKDLACGLRVAIPGIISSFNATTQTAIIQPAVTEQVLINGVSTTKPLPLLLDVPIVIPRAGGYALTLPVQAGDECLVVFADMCIDAWWQNGGAAPQDQAEMRRHDLSDGFAILGCWSQPRVLPAYSTASAQLRNDAGTVLVDIAATEITVTAPTVQVNAQHVNIAGSAGVNITGALMTMIESRLFLGHTHSGVSSGGGVSGPVV